MIADGGHDPLNVLGGIPTINLDYSPIWRLFPVVWTADAIEKGYRTKLTNALDIENAGAKGMVESIAGGAPKAVGFLVNCPVVYRINGSPRSRAVRGRRAIGPACITSAALAGSGSVVPLLCRVAGQVRQ